MPAVGIDSINLSSSEVAEEACFFTEGFLVRLITVGLRVRVIEGTTAFLLTLGRGVTVFIGAGIAVEVDFGPLPFRPSITI